LNRLHRDERGFISRTALLFVIIFALLGIVIIDGSALLFSKWQLSDAADAAAIDAAIAYAPSHNEAAAIEAGQATLDDRDSGGTVDAKKTKFDPVTNTVTLVVKEDVSTIFVKRIGPLEKYTHIETTSVGKPPTA
jgi:uncharacterized membrane protein